MTSVIIFKHRLSKHYFSRHYFFAILLPHFSKIFVVSVYGLLILTSALQTKSNSSFFFWLYCCFIIYLWLQCIAYGFWRMHCNLKTVHLFKNETVFAPTVSFWSSISFYHRLLTLIWRIWSERRISHFTISCVVYSIIPNSYI